MVQNIVKNGSDKNQSRSGSENILSSDESNRLTTSRILSLSSNFNSPSLTPDSHSIYSAKFPLASLKKKKSFPVTSKNLPDVLNCSEKHGWLRRKDAYERNVALLSEADGQISEIGEYIRRNDVKSVKEMLSNNTTGILLTKLSFFIHVECKHTSEVSNSNENSGFLIKEDEEEISIEKAKMIISPFHLAIISKQSDILQLFLDSICDDQNLMKMLLGEKTELVLEHNPNQYQRDDLLLNGINAFHLAVQFHSESLVLIMEYIRKKDILEGCRELLQMQNEDLHVAPIHLAANKDTNTSMRLLLDAGIDTEVKENRGYTPLHISAKCGTNDITELLLTYGAEIDATGNCGETPLHKARCPKSVHILLKHGADPNRIVKHDNGTFTEEKSVFSYLMEKNSASAEEILNFGISTNGKHLDSSSVLLVYDFEMFQKESVHTSVISSGQNMSEVPLHKKMVKLGHKDMLKHPLSEAFLHIKWKCVKKFFRFNLAFYMAFLFFVTSLSIVKTMLLVRYDEKYGTDIETSNYTSLTLTELIKVDTSYRIAFYVMYGVTIFLTIALALRELGQAMFSFKNWVKEVENWLEFLLITCTVMNLIYMWFDVKVSVYFEVCSLFLAWIEMTLLIGRSPSVGIYSFMFVHIIQHILFFLLIYVTIFISFALVFYILLPHHTPFQNPFQSLLKVFVMMIGEFDFEDNFAWDGIAEDGTNLFVQIFFVFFLLLVSIIISNLIIGMTVSKTDELFKEAGVIRLQKTTEQIAIVEDAFLRKNSLGGPIYSLRCFKHFRESTRVFEKLKRAGASESSWKVCVKPGDNMGKLKSQLGGISGALSLFNYNGSGHDVYIYNEEKQKRGKKLEFQLPNWVVWKTICLLKEINKKEMEVNEEDLSKKITFVCSRCQASYDQSVMINKV